MLESMRKSAGSWMIKILLMLIVVAFILTGAGSFMANRSNQIATVNGEAVTAADFERAYNSILSGLRNQFGGDLNEDIIKMFNVERQALEMLINRTLLLQVARENDMRVPAEALAESITGSPIFMTDGNFDPRRYEMILSQNRLTPQQFEAMQKADILTRNVQNMVTGTVSVTDAEAEEWYNWRNTGINVEYAVFKPSDFNDVKVSDEEIENFYTEHKADYQTEPEVKARYVRFSPEDYLSGTEISDEEIRNYYERNRSTYTSEETVSARHILIRVGEEADPETVEEKRSTAAEIAEKARSGEDFAKLAQTYSEGPTRSDGGDLGTFSRDDMVEPFSAAAFSLDPGEISEPVRTRFGWHIIKVEDRQEETVRPLESVEEEIRTRLAEREAKNLAYDEAISVYDISYDGDDLVENAKDLDLEIITTGLFDQPAGPDGVDDARAFADIAFELPLMEISDIHEIGGSYYLIQVIEKEESKIPGLESIREQVAEDARREKRKSAAAAAAESFLDTAKSAESFGEAAKKAGIDISETGFFNRNESIPDIGHSPAISSTAFGLSSENPLPGSALAQGANFYVIAFKEKTVPEASEFKENREQTVQELMSRKRQQTFEAWLNGLRENSDIEISDRFSG